MLFQTLRYSSKHVGHWIYSALIRRKANNTLRMSSNNLEAQFGGAEHEVEIAERIEVAKI